MCSKVYSFERNFNTQNEIICFLGDFKFHFSSCQVAQDTVVQVWKGGYQNELYNVTSLGYKAVLASCWYLDYIGYGDQWKKYYSCEPHDFNGKVRIGVFQWNPRQGLVY